MTFREKLADWISGGKLSQAAVDVERLRQLMKKSHDYYEENFAEFEKLSLGKISEAIRNLHAADAALREIIDQETPKANATVRRMAKIARKALEQ